MPFFNVWLRTNSTEIISVNPRTRNIATHVFCLPPTDIKNKNNQALSAACFISSLTNCFCSPLFPKTSPDGNRPLCVCCLHKSLRPVSQLALMASVMGSLTTSFNGSLYSWLLFIADVLSLVFTLKVQYDLVEFSSCILLIVCHVSSLSL